MLIRFEVSNFRSISASAELSMVAVDRDRPEARDQPMLNESLLPVASVFGPNASGKSNFLAALAWIRDAVGHSLRLWEDEIPVEPFAFGGGPGDPSEFTIELTIHGIRYEYALVVDRQRVLYEALFHYPEKKRRYIFEREGMAFKIQRGLGSISGARKLLTERTLALSVSRRFDEPLISDFVYNLLPMQYLESRRSRWAQTLRWFDESDQQSLFSERDQALALLRLADLGIDDVIIDEQVTTSRIEPEVRVARKAVRLVHRVADGNASLAFVAESEGTRTWFLLIGPVLNALRRGSLLLVDELDASLHPTLSAQLLRLFHDPATNPAGAQLVFTSHDTSLLNHLNRDEVWLTAKLPDGSTRLGPLTEFAGERVRKSQNLENAYLHGRFGALPQIDQSELLRALGLIG